MTPPPHAKPVPTTVRFRRCRQSLTSSLNIVRTCLSPEQKHYLWKHTQKLRAILAIQILNSSPFTQRRKEVPNALLDTPPPSLSSFQNYFCILTSTLHQAQCQDWEYSNTRCKYKGSLHLVHLLSVLNLPRPEAGNLPTATELDATLGPCLPTSKQQAGWSGDEEGTPHLPACQYLPLHSINPDVHLNRNQYLLNGRGTRN